MAKTQKIQKTEATNFHTRAVIVELNIRSWSGKKFDKHVTAETIAAHGASASAGRFNKSLLPLDITIEQSVKLSKAQKEVKQTNSHKALMQHIAAVRVWHYEQTLPWNDGEQMLPIANYTPYSDGIRDRQHTFNALLDDFVRDYPQLRDAAEKSLNGMFKHADYPANIAKRFSFDVRYYEMPSGDFRVDLPAKEIAALSAAAEARIRERFEEAHGDAVLRLHDAVTRIHERLADPNAIFRDTLIGNARELCDVLARLNVTGDANLERLRHDTALLSMTEPETLRQNEDIRAETAARAQNILDDFTATFGKGMFSK